MAKMMIKNFRSADEDRPFAGHGHMELLKFEGAGAIGRGIFEPGWRWSVDVKPIAGTDSCMASHYGYVLKGRMRARMDDGQEFEMGPGDVCFISPGHDAWVVGNEPCEFLDFAGAEHYAERGAHRPLYEPAPPVH